MQEELLVAFPRKPTPVIVLVHTTHLAEIPAKGAVGTGEVVNLLELVCLRCTSQRQEIQGSCSDCCVAKQQEHPTHRLLEGQPTRTVASSSLSARCTSNTSFRYSRGRALAQQKHLQQ